MLVGKSLYSVKVHGVVIMPNHFHAVVVPESDGALSGYLQWVTGSYASDFRARTNSVGDGHVFQRRFWSDSILESTHFLSVLRYIEANPVRGRLVDLSERWPWNSVALRMRVGHGLLDPLPVELPRDWLTIVNLPQPDKEIATIRRARAKNRRGHTESRSVATGFSTKCH
jgi:putative transposase